MRGTIRLHCQACQQQSQNDAENQLLLLRQPIHADNIAENDLTASRMNRKDAEVPENKFFVSRRLSG
jgi:hypothetical protein